MSRWVLLMLSASLWGCGENLHPLAPGKMFELEFQRGHASKTIAYDNVTVTAQITPDKNDPSVQTVRVVIQAPGFDPYVAKLEQSPAGSNYTFGIGPLSAQDPVASVILQDFSGGAHCCTTIQFVRPVAGKMKLIQFDQGWDGEPMSNFPEDVDGDGEADIITSDPAFLYAFSDYASSLPPPLIFNVLSDHIVDVSDRPGFRPVFEQFASEARKACFDTASGPQNGACAGFVAAEARLGRAGLAFAAIQKQGLADNAEGLPDGCKVSLVDHQCPEGQTRRFFTFAGALLWFLEEHGYVIQKKVAG